MPSAAKKYEEELEDQVEDDEDDESDDDEDDSQDDGNGNKESSTDGDFGDDDDSGSEETDEERRERRRKERAERKQRQKEAKAAADRERKRLLLENEDLKRRVARIEGVHTSGYEAKVNSAIEEAKSYLFEAEKEMRAAITAGDGDRAFEAQNLRDEAKEKLQQFEMAKKQIEAAKKVPQQGLQHQVQRNIQIFRQRHPAYRPGGDDEYSQAVEAADRALTATGKFNHADPQYWMELEKQVSKLSTGTASESRSRSQAPAKKSPTSGSGAKGRSTRKGFTLSPERVNAMKALGYKRGSAEWNDMKESYRKYDEEHKNG